MTSNPQVEHAEKQKIIFSAVQPSGKQLTLGNYMGAINNWLPMQEKFHCLYAVADLHSLTVRQDPAKLRQQTLEIMATFLACGLDPEKNIIFIQSHVPAHAELAWILNCYTMFGELSRMTQFKDKSAKNADNVNAGLFTYPALMAADILLYQADYVPVGQDQKQHVEICRDIAGRFNGIYGNVFTIPEPYIPKVGAKIMSLTDPAKKMSKSDPNANSFILLTDKPEDIVRKFKRAVTDSGSEIRAGEGKDGVNNLLVIYSVATGKTIEQVEQEFAGKGYGEFKLACGEAVAELLRPVREKIEDYMKNRDYLESVYRMGAEKAAHYAARTLDKVRKKVGLIAKPF